MCVTVAGKWPLAIVVFMQYCLYVLIIMRLVLMAHAQIQSHISSYLHHRGNDFAIVHLSVGRIMWKVFQHFLAQLFI